MHRIVLGALADTIARALFPKVGDSVPALGPIEMQDSPTQPRSEEPEGDPADAVPEAEPQNFIIQSGPEETAESGAAVAGVEPENDPTQPEAEESEHELLSTFDALWPGMGGSASILPRPAPGCSEPTRATRSGRRACRCIHQRQAPKRSLLTPGLALMSLEALE